MEAVAAGEDEDESQSIEERKLMMVTPSNPALIYGPYCSSKTALCDDSR